MTAFIAEQFDIAPDAARARQRDYFQRYGTTLRGLMVEHGLEPAPFLDYVHDIDLTTVDPNPALVERLGRLPGRKLVFTNASRLHAERIMERIGITPHIEAIFDIAAADYLPKPDRAGYALMLERHQVSAAEACMIEDMAGNLAPAKALGMTTVWLKGELPWAKPGEPEPDYIDYVADDLETWLDGVLAARAG
jgi:putative hydrolase of the HAD superfamily